MSADAVDASRAPAFYVEMSEEDKIKEQEELIEELNKPGMLQTFVDMCKKIGQTAIAINNNFIVVKDGFDELVKKYGKDFPKVEEHYVPRWEAFMDVGQYFSFLLYFNNFCVC